MTYATRADLEDRYGATEIEQRESGLPSGAVDRALGDADGEINSYVAGRYSVPLSPVPSNIPRLASAIARYNLLGDAATDKARADYDDAIRFLKDVQAGRALLQDATPLTGSAPSNRVSMVTNDRVFARGARDI